MENQIKLNALEKKMQLTAINTFTGKMSLYDLIHNVGVRNRVEYFNLVERKAPKKLRTIHNKTVVKEVTHDRGLIFNDGFEIRHVDKPVYNYAKDAEVKYVRERAPINR